MNYKIQNRLKKREDRKNVKENMYHYKKQFLGAINSDAFIFGVRVFK
jgi:hypothetical protein